MKWATTLAVATAAVCLASVQGRNNTRVTDCIQLPNARDPACLIFMSEKKTWAGMQKLCNESGLILARIDGDLHSAVVQHINDQGVGVYDDEAFWIGGSDEALEGSWKWIIDGSAIPLGTPHWYPCNGQPNGGTLQNCLSLYTPDFFYHSLECEREIMGICQE